MAISRLSTVSQNKITASTSTLDFTHTVDTGTDLLIVAIALEGDEELSFPTGWPVWDSAGVNESLTQIRDTGDTGSAGDVRVYVYGLVSPTAKTATISMTSSSNVNPAWCCAVNYSGVDTASVAAATDYISEDVNTGATNNTALTATGITAGDFQFAVAAFQGQDGNPASQPGDLWAEVIDDTTGGSNSADFAVAFYDTTTFTDDDSSITIQWSVSDENTGVRVRLNPGPVVDQEHYRFATPITGSAHESWTLVGTEDNSYEVTLDSNYALIVKVGSGLTAVPTEDYQLEYNVDGAGWNDVNGSSSNVRTVDSGDVDQAVSSTERLTTSSRTFANSRLDEANGAVNYTLPGDRDLELYYAITFRSADLSGGESITFRITLTSAATDVNYDITPTATTNADASHTAEPAKGTLTLAGKVPESNETHFRAPAREQLALAGKVPTVHWTVESDREELALTGKVPTLFREYVRAPDREELALTGKVPTLFREYVEAPDREELTLTGKVPVFNVGTNISIPKGTLTVVGKAAILDYTFVDITHEELQIIEKIPVKVVNFIRGPPIEELDLQGKVPTVFRQKIVAPDREQLALSGQVPTVHWTVSPALGELDLAGKVPVAFREKFSAPDREQLALAGKVPTVFRQRYVAPDREQLALAGEVPTLFREYVRAPDREQLTLAGKAPTLLIGKSLPAKGTLALAGKVPTFGATLSITVPSTQLRLKTLVGLWIDGKAPTITVTAGIERTPARVQLTLTGKAPAFDIALAPDREQLALTGKVPEFNEAYFSDPTRLSLVLTGKAPELLGQDTLSPTEGTLTLTGKVPESNETHFSDPARRQLVLAGKVPTILQTFSAEPARLELTLTGKQPELAAADAEIPPKVALTLAGKVPESNETHFSDPTRLELSLTGKVPTFLVQTLELPTEATLALAGKAPALALTIAPAREELTLTGKTPLTGEQQLVEPDREQLVLTGQAPTPFREKTVAPAIETLSLAGKTPVVLQTFSVAPAKADLTLSGTVPFTIIPGVEGAFLLPAGRLVLYSRRGLWLDGRTPTISISVGEITTGAGALALTGKTPTLEYDWVVAPAKGELTLAGQSLNVQEYLTEPGTETLALTGKAPIVGPPITIAVNRLQLSLNAYATTRAYGLLLTGQALTFETPGVKSASAAALSLTTYAPTVASSETKVPTPTGQAALLGYWPVLSIVNPNQESTFILEGYAPISWTTSPTFFPGRGELTLTTITPISDVEGLAPTGSLVLVGQQPNTVARTIIPGAASLSLTGTLPARGPEPPAASLSLTGAIVYTRRTTSPGTGTVSLTSQSPTVSVGVNSTRSPAAGSLALAGKAPNGNVGFSPLTGTGSLTLTGYAVIFDRSYSFNLDTQALTLTGAAPSAFQDLAINIPKGSLVIDEQTFKVKLKRIKIRGARKRLTSLTTEYDIEILYR
jgi:hypothetical protein